jgi:hypothetical protein
MNSKYSPEHRKSKVEHPKVMAMGDLCDYVDRTPRRGLVGCLGVGDARFSGLMLGSRG